MNGVLRKLVTGAGRAAGLQVDRIGDGRYVVQRRTDPRTVVRLGDDRFGADVLVGPTQTFKGANLLQKRMSEFLVHEQVAWVLRETEVNLVIDVGANVGQFAKALRRAGYQGRIASFEPVAEPVRKLRQAASGDPEWQVHQCALGDQEGQATINARPGTMSSMLESSEFGENWSAKLRENSTETIQVRRLDSSSTRSPRGWSSPCGPT